MVLSMMHKSPTSKLCTTKANMIPWNRVFKVSANIKVAASNGDAMRTSILVVAKPVRSNHIMKVARTRTQMINLFRHSATSFALLNVFARNKLLLRAFSWSIYMQPQDVKYWLLYSRGKPNIQDTRKKMVILFINTCNIL